jgi:hypothetical protein
MASRISIVYTTKQAYTYQNVLTITCKALRISVNHLPLDKIIL